MGSDNIAKFISFLYKLSYLYSLYLIIKVGIRVNSFIVQNKIFSVQSPLYEDFSNNLILEWTPLRNYGFIIISVLLLITLFLFVASKNPTGNYILQYSIRSTVLSLMFLMFSFVIGVTSGSFLGLAQNKTFYKDLPFTAVFGIFLWIGLLLFGPLFIYLLTRAVKESKGQTKKNFKILSLITGIICVTIIAAIIYLPFIK